MRDLSAIFKAYDVRGLVPEQIDADLVTAIGSAFAEVLEVGPGQSVVVGRDMRGSSQPLADAFAAGVMSRGADVTDIGLASTDQLYFASGHLGVPGAMFTASHNPAQYNGIKLCRAGAAPVGAESGLVEIRDRVAELLGAADATESSVSGAKCETDLLEAYAAHLHSLVPVTGRRLKVVVDAGNGMAGHTGPAVFASLDVDLVPMFFELDGNFPNHEANPIEPENLQDLMAAVRREHADLGFAFDGDADRCFVIDEQGEPVSPSTLTALIAVRELEREPGATVIHNLICSRAVPEIVTEHGGIPVRTRVGHSFIKARMAEEGAIFGGEHSGHFYFREFWRADSGMLAALHALAELAQTQPGTALSTLLGDYSRYAASGEINSRVEDQDAAMAAAAEQLGADDDVRIDHLDGLSVEHDDWWLNIRASNTEPLLRLNVEAVDVATMERARDRALAIIRETRP